MQRQSLGIHFPLRARAALALALTFVLGCDAEESSPVDPEPSVISARALALPQGPAVEYRVSVLDQSRRLVLGELAEARYIVVLDEDGIDGAALQMASGHVVVLDGDSVIAHGEGTAELTAAARDLDEATRALLLGDVVAELPMVGESSTIDPMSFAFVTDDLPDGLDELDEPTVVPRLGFVFSIQGYCMWWETSSGGTEFICVDAW